MSHGAAMAVPFEPLAAFVGQPLRSFYQQVICGGLVFQLSDGSRLLRTVVPMAFQSALAGIMLAADLVKHSAGFPMSPTTSTRVNLLRPLGSHLHDPKAKDSSGRCICSDEDFIAALQRTARCQAITDVFDHDRVPDESAGRIL
ncbi:hypothetical protein [Mesorhizobium sp. M0140]|uniref:hypothetical protein n=1 Tax=Mesorhizobium sp. M0140 TaxID=2956893 RepID=UPI003336FE6B